MAVIMSLCAAPSLAPRRFPVATKPSSQGVVRLSLPPRHLQGPGGRSKKTGLVKAVRDDASRDIHTDYYQVLGVAPEAGSPELRHAFRILAKSIHPDVAGTETAAAFQMVKTAYTVLSNPQSRHIYDAGRSLFGMHSKFGDFTGLPLSKNTSPNRPDAHFVDENSCIGCRACVYEAPHTFSMDESYGKARVTHQWADNEQNIEIAMEICPVDCIHRVDKDSLAVLEFVQRSMPVRSMMIHSDSSSSGKGRGLDESPFVAAERFEAKKEKLMADAKERAKGAARLSTIRSAVENAGLGRGWRSWWGAADKSEQVERSPVHGPSCPLIYRDSRVVLALPQPEKV